MTCKQKLASEAKGQRKALLDQSEELSTYVQETYDQMTAELQKEAGELADKKLAREDLATLLTEAATRLKKDFKLPKG